MQVILDSRFARPGSAAIRGGKKGEFRDWTKSMTEATISLHLHNTRISKPLGMLLQSKRHPPYGPIPVKLHF